MTTYKVWDGSNWIYIDTTSYDDRYVQIASKGQVNGVVPLDVDGKIPSDYLPPISVTEVYAQETEPSSPQEGWVWVKPSTGEAKIYDADTTTWLTLGNATGYITSVNGHTGASVTVTKSDVGLGNVSNVDQTNASNLTSGTVAVARLPAATSSTAIS